MFIMVLTIIAVWGWLDSRVRSIKHDRATRFANEIDKQDVESITIHGNGMVEVMYKSIDAEDLDRAFEDMLKRSIQSMNIEGGESC